MGANGRVWSIDITLPGSPREIGSITTPGEVNELFLAGSYLYVAAGDVGLLVVDVSDPTQPVEVASVAIEDGADKVSVAGDRAFVLRNTNSSSVGMVVIDVSNPGSPRVVGRLDDIPGSIYLAPVVAGQQALVSGYSGFHIIDVSSPADLRVVGSLDISRHVSDDAVEIYVIGSYALVFGNMLVVMDISDPGSPKMLGALYEDLGSSEGGVAVTEGYAFGIGYNDELLVMDISEPTLPRLVSFMDRRQIEDAFDISFYPADVYVAGSYAFMAGGSNDGTGLVVIRVSPLAPAIAAMETGDGTRPLPSTITVTRTGDSDDGACDQDCSLREAIAFAHTGDTIAIPAGTYTLTLDEELVIDKDLTLEGAGSGDTIVQAAESFGIARHGVFAVRGGKVTLSGMTIRHGAYIFNSGSLTIMDSTITANKTQSSEDFRGIVLLNGTFGSIFDAARPTLRLINTVVSGNVGGLAVANLGGTLTIADSTIRGNTGSGVGNGGTLSLINSTISGNGGAGLENTWNAAVVNSTISGNRGSGVSNLGTLTLVNSTVSGNSAAEVGGGILNLAALKITNSTVSGNSAKRGGGISNGAEYETYREEPGILTISNSIIAGNSASRGGPDCSGLLVSQGHNLIGTNDECTLIRANAVTGDSANVDPKLGPLQDNDGPTFTHALLPGSPAIDASDDASCPSSDQRGLARPQGTACDIGAYELAR